MNNLAKHISFEDGRYLKLYGTAPNYEYESNAQEDGVTSVGTLPLEWDHELYSESLKISNPEEAIHFLGSIRFCLEGKYVEVKS